jgi:hypothetical protein
VIEPTPAMVTSADLALTEAAVAGTSEALAAARAVLAIINRDYDLRPRIQYPNPFTVGAGRCRWCGCGQVFHTPARCTGQVNCPCEGWESEGTP